MKPYEAAVGNKITKYFSDDIINTKLVNMQKEYTKLWVSNVIDDGTYVKSILNLIDNPIDNPKHAASPYMFIPNGFVISYTETIFIINFMNNLLNGRMGISLV